MDEKTYKRWWQLHLRTVKGEKLEAAEQVEYESGLNMLDEEEKEQFRSDDLTRLRQLRSQVFQQQETHAQLKEQSSQLDKKIADLEKTYQAVTGYTLTTEPYAAS